ncbi:neprilysin-4-like [Diorhabda carinulata]|uniref:neprilysin-4-like n=1 Tax=Diorhabda carinulata TaxID=1163345 RepID=UPI0025A07D44|nr:neprilysin-4-like [Diorhabda carinulata]
MFCKLLLIILSVLSATNLKCINGPFSIKKYDQADMLQEDEDRREIFRDIKTIFAPEYRVYTNDSICSTVTKKKRANDYCRDDIYKEYDPRRDFFSKSSGKGFYENNILYRKYFEETQPKNYKTNNSTGTFLHNESTNNKRDFRQKVLNKLQVDKNFFETKNMNKNINDKKTNKEKMSTNEIWPIWHSSLSTKQIRNLQSEIMRKFMNTNIDPCIDFYEYACGNWKTHYSIPPDRATYDIFEMVRENLDKTLHALLTEKEEKSPTATSLYFQTKSFIDKDFLPHKLSSAVVKARLFYQSCINEKVLEQRGDKPLKDLLAELGRWPILEKKWKKPDFDIIWLLATLRLLNNDILIAQWVGPDMKNSKEYIVHIDQTTLGLPAREYYLEESNIKYIQAYRIFILTVAQLMGASPKTAEQDVDEIIKFEMALATIMASSEERRNISEIYLRTDIASLTLYFPQFDWKKYFDIVLGTNINLKTPVACYCTKFLIELTYLMSNTESRVLQNYVLWRFVRHRTNNLDNRFLEAKQRFYYILFGREKSPPRWQFCVTQVNSNMGMALGSLFVKKYFDKSSKTDTIKMTKQLQDAFKITLQENTWLDNNTKDYANMKLDYMDLKIGFPDFILNETLLDMRYHDVEVHEKYFFENVLTFLRHLTQIEQKRMGAAVNRTLWSTPPAVVNAYYSRNKNQIMFPAGMLQPPFYNRHFPKALNFGGIGVVIGHEITHGFDDKGRLFDHEGNLHMWWRQSSIEKFYERSQCMIEQYGQYVLPDIHIALDGFITQGENIADNGGLKQAFRAYETWLERHPDADETLPNLNITGRQLFFLNFAQVWCGQQRVEAAKSRIKTSVHAPGIFRVIGVLSNSREFSRVYNCPKNSPMNPDYKCIIW